MRDARYLIDREYPEEVYPQELPIRVAEDWDELVIRANRAADIIDRHLEFESRLQGRELRPSTLCPEQKVSLVSDLMAA